MADTDNDTKNNQNESQTKNIQILSTSDAISNTGGKVYKSVVSVLQFVEDVNAILNRFKDQGKSSYIEESKIFRVEPVCVVDGTLKSSEAIKDAVSVSLSLFSSFFIQAANASLYGVNEGIKTKLKDLTGSKVTYSDLIRRAKMPAIPKLPSFESIDKDSSNAEQDGIYLTPLQLMRYNADMDMLVERPNLITGKKSPLVSGTKLLCSVEEQYGVESIRIKEEEDYTFEDHKEYIEDVYIEEEIGNDDNSVIDLDFFKEDDDTSSLNIRENTTPEQTIDRVNRLKDAYMGSYKRLYKEADRVIGSATESFHFKEMLREMRETEDLVVGRLFNLEIISMIPIKEMGMDGREYITTKQHSNNIPIMIRFITAYQPPSSIVNMFGLSTPQSLSIKRTIAKALGKYNIFADGVLANDVTMAARKTMMLDKSGYMTQQMGKDKDSRLLRIFSGTRRPSSISSVFIISSTTKRNIETSTGVNFDIFDERNRLMADMGIMVMGVIDDDSRTVEFFYHSLERSTINTFNEMKRSTKGNGVDVTSLIQQTMAGSINRTF